MVDVDGTRGRCGGGAASAGSRYRRRRGRRFAQDRNMDLLTVGQARRQIQGVARSRDIHCRRVSTGCRDRVANPAAVRQLMHARRNDGAFDIDDHGRSL